MLIIFQLLFYVSLFIIFWAMIGYPLSLILLDKLFFKNKRNHKNYTYKPSVTVMVVAHNEEKVIKEKLNNLKEIVYPKDKIEFLVASDNSTDETNNIVQKYINENPSFNLRLFKAKNRKGKTNAQNEAQKTVTTEYLVMTDANSIIKADAISELMASFVAPDISYVTGKLIYTNKEISDASLSESTYWDLDLKTREIESNIQTITAGNGALYACRNSEYVDFDPIKSHDSSMPLYYALKEKRAIANHDAIAYEKAGESIEDEFKRKVRMNRVILDHILPSIKILNVFKYRWFTYFYLGHRTSRYLLWISHLILYLSNLYLAFSSRTYLIVFLAQTLFWLIALVKKIFNTNDRVSTLINYYATTVVAQWYGVINIIMGRTKPFWEKAESTR